MGETRISVRSLGKVFPDGTRALQDVGFDIAAGETFGCLGRNGAGKTTLVNLLTTLDTPTEGTASICGHDVVARREEVRSRIGASLQQVALDELMTGREHLEFVGRLAGLGAAAVRAKADELVRLFGLEAAVDKMVAVCSGGTRRRLDLALALLRDPEVLFLDEPTTGLDPQNRRALWEWVRSFAAEGGTVLLTTQYLEEADELADRVAVLDSGRIAVLDTPSALKAQAGGKQVQVRPVDGLERSCVLGEFGTRAALDPGGDVIVDAAREGELLSVLGRLAALGVPQTALAVVEPTLEDVFVRLTGASASAESDNSTASGLAAIGRSLAGGTGRNERP
ncbi:ATP-binding cassette domain-containing protein [Streptomyces sp. NPDC094032]|uniref:ATP-binding cassette domain-containing protein n=1 Tax=Streptomyces sp. NPDC094032 TaxID=3155308 RepID=UPI00331D2F91